MPAVHGPVKVLVTGASGFLAVWVVKYLLDHQFHVRGTVRSPSKGEYLRELFEKDHPGKFEYVIVEDLLKVGGFDEAVKDVDAIAHTASPVFFSPTAHPDEVIGPALKGTLSVLESAKKYGTSVKRIVITSSGAAMLDPHDGPYVYGEKDWNNYSIKLVEEQGINADGVHKYRASKALAEKAAWNFIKDSEGKISFDLVTVLPPYIMGPILHQVSSVDELNLSSKRLYDALARELPKEELTQYAGNYIDVRDCAEVHVDAFEKEELAGRRLVTGNGAIAWQDFYDAANSLPPGSLPELPFTIPKGEPKAGDKTRPTFVQYSQDTPRMLGKTFRKLPEVVKDSLVSFKEKRLI